MSSTTIPYDADVEDLAEQVESLDWTDDDSCSESEYEETPHDHLVDLADLEKLRNHKPVYSHTSFERRGWSTEITWKALDGETTTVYKKDPEHKEDDEMGRVQVDYMPRVFMDQEFQHKWGNCPYIPIISLLRGYNNDVTSDKVLKSSWEKNEHLDAELMQRSRNATARSWNFWKNSDTCTTFEYTYGTFTKKIEHIAAISAPIKRIVCFGLGKMMMSPSQRTHSMIWQHMSVLSIAKTLKRYYNEAGKKPGKVQIVLQEPKYVQSDWTLISELHQAMGCEASSEIQFVDDPDGLLEIDSNTMIIAPNLAYAFPWYQILADLFASGSGPAVMIGDHVSVNNEQVAYALRDCGSPAVARFLTERYVQVQKAAEDPGPAILQSGGYAALRNFWDEDQRKLGMPAEMANLNRGVVDWFSSMDF
ncbi:hypothetical protein G6011_09374 [Alternaria panax]|uniref:SRR1-like domain-containing protein n=1 Tax=Alternaria panax TaxID=48097 RepID=A0AAD4NMI4_9PLEO|nr:hypothetical protein G6011_09374 [Alternaria panax]